MKLISFISIIFIAQLVFNVSAMPQLPISLEQPTARPEAVTAQAVNGGLVFTQNFLQLLGMLFNNFNALVPRFVGLFTQNQNGANPTTPTLPALPSLPGGIQLTLPSGFNNRLQPEKINNDANVQSQTPKRDIELIENGIGDDGNNDADKLPF